MVEDKFFDPFLLMQAATIRSTVKCEDSDSVVSEKDKIGVVSDCPSCRSRFAPMLRFL